MRTSLALKIFLSFWLIHAVIFVVLGLVPDRGASAMLLDRARLDGEVAASFYEHDGADGCSRFLGAVVRTGLAVSLYSDTSQLLCSSHPSPDDRPPGALLAGASEDGSVASTGGGRTAAVVAIDGPSGRRYKAAVVAGPRSRFGGGRRPFPYLLLALAISVSGVVCLLLAHSLARPLQRMRAASRQLKEGNLSARAAAADAKRRDEIGDVVRDFNAMAERIESLLLAQKQLLSDMSHELRSPLARLNVALELARRTPGAAAGAHLARIEVETERMNELIGRILALARAENAARAAHAEAVDLAEVVRRVADDAQYEAHRTNKRVDTWIQANATIRGDRLLASSAVENVVRNAIAYTAPGTSVDVSLTANDTEARIVVRDHGTGVPDAELQRLFLPFYRLDASRDRQSGGMGLGLSIAERATAALGGAIKAENAAGGGLRVIIGLPIQQNSSR